jgi:hypothetical protein
VSHTDKDRPDWVIRHTEGFPIEHNHVRGKCVVETLEYARNYNAGSNRPTYRHTWKDRCPKNVKVEFFCTKAEPFEKKDRSWPRITPAEYWTDRVKRDEWHSKRCWQHWVSYVTQTWQSTQCLGHVRWERDESVPCVTCDNEPERPTCEPSWYGETVGWRYWTAWATRNKSLTNWCHVEYHGPERRRERDTLREQAKAWNAGDELDDWDYENRQGRRSVQWNLF